MANTIRIKRRPSSGSAGAPSSASLYNGELAFNENDNTLYYAYGSGVGGISTAVPAIAGSGAYALRGGTNATGIWPIGITGNSATVTNGVYTTGDQNIGGAKTFTGITTISGNLSPYLLFKSANAGNYGNIVFDGVNYDGAVQSSYITSNTGNMEIAHGQKIQLNSALEVKAANTSGNSVGYFAVFDSNPNSSLTTLKSVSKDQILDDIGAATSGLILTAGSGLVGGGSLSTSRTFDIGQGDGITVSADSIAVDSTVVRTTGTQSVGGVKTFSNRPIFSSGIILRGTDIDLVLNHNRIESTDGAGIDITNDLFFNANNTIFNYYASGGENVSFYDFDSASNVLTVTDRVSIRSPNGSISGIYFPVWTSNPATNAQYISSRTASQLKGDIGLGNVENTSLSSVTFTAGSGLVGGGTLASSRTFDIGQGDGISVSADSIAVDNTVVRSTSVNVSGYIPTWAATNSKTLNVGYQVSTSLDTNNSSSFIPRADAVKTYVDNAIVSGISTNDAMVFKGAIDCSTNPNYPAADRGWTYKVSVAGKIGGASGPTVEVNDTVICTTDGTSAGTHAVVGSNWVILQTNIVDASILVTGPTSATSGNIPLFDGTSGKIIKDGYAASANSSASTVVLRDANGNFNSYSITCNNTLISLSGILSYGTLGFKATAAGSAATYFPVFTTDPTSIASNVSSRTAAQVKGDIGLGNVENTALSTWAGSSNITTLGTIGTGTWNATTIAVNKGGTGQTSYVNGELLIGNSTGNSLTKATLTQGTAIDITNGNGSITIGHNDTSTLTGAQGSNGIASFTVDGMGHVTAVTTATYLTAATVCAAIVDCTLDGGTF